MNTNLDDIDRVTRRRSARFAYALANVVHEGLGHGGGLPPARRPTRHVQRDLQLADESTAERRRAAGHLRGRKRQSTSSSDSPSWDGSGVGPHSRRAGATSCGSSPPSIWLTAFGYPLYSGIGGIGDWARVIAGARPVWLFRLALTVVGAGLSLRGGAAAC